MDREEAIKTLQNVLPYESNFAEAIKMAIEALKAEEKNCEECEFANPCLYCKHTFEQQEESEE